MKIEINAPTPRRDVVCSTEAAAYASHAREMLPLWTARSRRDRLAGESCVSGIPVHGCALYAWHLILD